MRQVLTCDLKRNILNILKSEYTSAQPGAQDGWMHGWSQDVACVYDVISPCIVRHFGREKKITDNFRLDRSGLESSH